MMTDAAVALKRAVVIAGGQAPLGRKIGRRQSTIWTWLRDGIPAAACPAVEKATGGAVTRFQLRPDVFGEGPSAQSAGDKSCTTVSLPPGHDIVEHRGNHMGDTLPSGTLVIVDRLNKHASPDGLALICTMPGCEEVRRVQVIPSMRNPRVRVSTDHPAYPAYEVAAADLRIAGRVVATINRVL